MIQTDAPSAFNSILRKLMLENVAAYTPALTEFVTKCHDERPASLVFQMDSRQRTNKRTLPWNILVYNKDT